VVCLRPCAVSNAGSRRLTGDTRGGGLCSVREQRKKEKEGTVCMILYDS
jgi:hypothetical protein